MKKSVLLCAFFLGIISQTAWGEIPRTISYQGVLTDTSGATLDGDHDFVFKLYDAETGGNQLWSETHVSVTVSRGVFNVTLGSVDAFPDTIFINPRWMAIMVDGGPELSPRTKLNASPYSIRSQFSTYITPVLKINNQLSPNISSSDQNPTTIETTVKCRIMVVATAKGDQADFINNRMFATRFFVNTSEQLRQVDVNPDIGNSDPFDPIPVHTYATIIESTPYTPFTLSIEKLSSGANFANIESVSFIIHALPIE